MISRVWRGRTSVAKADEYQRFLKETAYPDYGGVQGNKGWMLLRRPVSDAVEFMFVSFWDSMDALVEYAGGDPQRPKYYAEDRAALLELPQTVEHHDVVDLQARWDAHVVATRATETDLILQDLEQQLAAAWVNGDRGFIENLLADDWTVTDPSCRILTKRQVLDETFSSNDRRIESMTVDDVRVRLLDGAAVVTGRTQATGSYRGHRAAVTLRFTDVFHFRGGRWQIVASQGASVTEGLL